MKRKITKKQRISLSLSITDILHNWDGDCERLLPNQIYNLTIDYPVTSPIKFSIKTGKKGLGLIGILKKIGQAYNKIYADAKKNGVWGHDIGDLYLEEIYIDYKNKTILLSIGS